MRIRPDPPRAAVHLLRILLPDEEREFVFGDLEEYFRGRILPLKGPRAARRWYWHQTLCLVWLRWRISSAIVEVDGRTGDGAMSNFLRDLCYGLRMMRKSPGFTTVALLTLALGIGANATIFTWLNSILVVALPGAKAPHELVAVIPVSPEYGLTSVSYPDYVDYRDRNTTLAGLTALENQAMSLSGDGKPERIWAELVTSNFFDVLGVRPILGRTFLADEEKVPNAAPVVILSHTLWQRRFGGDPSVIGRKIILNNYPFTVVGVAPEGFAGGETALRFDLWVPMMMQEKVIPGKRLEARGNSWLIALGRLKPGVTPQQAAAELTGIARQLQQDHPERARGSVSVYPLWKSPKGATAVLGPVLLLLMGVVGLVLLIACANVANLLLARATGRRREIAVRLALGAGRGRLLRQLLTESILLSIAGGVLGLVCAYWTTGLLRTLAPPTDFPIGLAINLDVRVFAFTFILALLTGIVFGLAPALQASRADMLTPLKDESAAIAGGGRRAWLRSGLVVSQVALSVLLLVAAGLFLRSLERAQTFPPGFNAGGVLLASVDLFPNGYRAEAARAFYKEVLEKVRALPGVESVSLARRIPLGLGGSSSSSITVEGYELRNDERPWTYVNSVGPDYLRTMQIPLINGRDFSDRDNVGAPPVAIINETMARRYWPAGDAVGKRFRFGEDGWFTVVGIAGNIHSRSLNEPAAAYAYLCLLQFYRPDVTVHVRAAGDPGLLAGVVQREIQSVDPALPVFSIRTLQVHISAAFFQQRMAGRLLTVFGLLALTLATVGIYGVLAYAIGQRTHEIGLRMALGAGRADVLRLVLGQGMLLAGAGLVLGLAVAFALTRLMRTLLFGVSPTDPATFAGVALVLALVAAAACYVPARRATRVDPVVALRYE
jgi:predicted permease